MVDIAKKYFWEKVSKQNFECYDIMCPTCPYKHTGSTSHRCSIPNKDSVKLAYKEYMKEKLDTIW